MLATLAAYCDARCRSRPRLFRGPKPSRLMESAPRRPWHLCQGHESWQEHASRAWAKSGLWNITELLRASPARFNMLVPLVTALMAAASWRARADGRFLPRLLLGVLVLWCPRLLQPSIMCCHEFFSFCKAIAIDFRLLPSSSRSCASLFSLSCCTSGQPALWIRLVSECPTKSSHVQVQRSSEKSVLRAMFSTQS